MTIKDIAKLANVSITTVSMIINNKDKNISEATREKVLKIIKEHNYVPNSVARSMVTKKSNLLGLIIPDITNPYFADMARSIEDVANELGYNVILCNADDNPVKELEYINLLKEKLIDGLVIVPVALSNHEEINNLRKNNIPVVVLDRKTQEETSGVICFDNIEAGYMATKHLLENGHRRIGCITGPDGNESVRERLIGYEQALNEYSLSFDSSLIFDGDYKFEGGEKAMKQLLNCNVTAVFSLNDLMAIGAYRSIYEANLKIPQDISIIGIDDLYLSTVITPALSTIKQPASEMGIASVNMLDDIIKKKNNNEDFIKFSPVLIKRSSVLKINQ